MEYVTQQTHTNNSNATTPQPLLRVENLHVEFHGTEGVTRAVNGVSIDVPEGASVGIVGESGCGKTVTAFSTLQLLPASARITKGAVSFRRRDGKVTNLLDFDPKSKAMKRIRGSEISMIFQEPMSALSPVHTVGDQIVEMIRLHRRISREEAWKEAVRYLDIVGIPDAEQRVHEYTFQYSGGMRQRAMIAMALSSNPRLVIADEPTTALDVTIQAQVLKLVQRLQGEFGLSLVLITHDLGVVAQMVDYIYVMYLGLVVEHGSVEQIFDRAAHPYTADLLESIPTLTEERESLAAIKGSVPHYLPTGCPYHTRCSRYIGDICRDVRPELLSVSPDHAVRCHLFSSEGKEGNHE
jgi:oligopeptide/dipeptide ABC transporter ATP-binding protein